jgi:hypothetical protein
MTSLEGWGSAIELRPPAADHLPRVAYRVLHDGSTVAARVSWHKLRDPTCADIVPGRHRRGHQAIWACLTRVGEWPTDGVPLARLANPWRPASGGKSLPIPARSPGTSGRALAICLDIEILSACMSTRQRANS